MTDRPTTWRVEPAGPHNDRRYYLMRRNENGDLRFMFDDDGAPRAYSSDAAAQAAAAIENAKEKR